MKAHKVSKFYTVEWDCRKCGKVKTHMLKPPVGRCPRCKSRIKNVKVIDYYVNE